MYLENHRLPIVSSLYNFYIEAGTSTEGRKMLNIGFETGNRAFWKETEGNEYFNFDEVEEILGYVLLSMKEGDTDGKIKDSNGNSIGEWEWK